MSRSRWAARVGRGRLAARLAVVVPVGMLGASVLGGSAAAALPSNCSQTGTTVTCTYTTAGTYTFSVPAGVSSLDVTAVGASGGEIPGVGPGGPGASVKDTAVPVGTFAGHGLTVVVGGVGGNGGIGGAATGGAGGTPGGGGAGGGAPANGADDVAGSGGGGFSGLLDPSANALVIAAGGGGTVSGAVGGAGDTGSGGGQGGSCTICAGGGGGGTSTMGGMGTAGVGGGGNGTNGASLTGGQGGSSNLNGGGGFEGGGGGGGGGYYGGGGGGGDQLPGGGPGGGGGGSSFGITGLTNEQVATGPASVTISYTDADLAIAKPTNITVDATGPSGATVTYPAPVVTDPDDSSPPAAVCTPKSGSVFGIGTTTVTCTATDTDDTDSPVSTSFTVTVKGAAAQLADLYQAVPNTRAGKALARTVALAEHQVAGRHPLLACQTLNLFIIEVQLEPRWRIPAGTAAQLIAAARQIQAVLGCSRHRSHPFGYFPFGF